MVPHEFLFDIDKLRPVVLELFNLCQAAKETNQVSLRYRSSVGEVNPLNLLQDGVGSLYDFSTNSWLARERDFDCNHPHIIGTCLEEVIIRLQELTRHHIGRVRIMRLRGKTCYSFHQDPDVFRFHIPIVTNEFCFYLTKEGGMEQMPEPGRVYMVRTNCFHTALNTSSEDRIHLVASTYI